MKRCLIILLFWSLLACSLQAGFHLEWDDNQTGMTYRIYEKVGETWVKVATTTEKRHAMEAAAGTHVYAVTASSADFESAMSNEATAVIPSAPTKFRVSIEATITILEVKP
jgi:hypothetical protein